VCDPKQENVLLYKHDFVDKHMRVRTHTRMHVRTRTHCGRKEPRHFKFYLAKQTRGQQRLSATHYVTRIGQLLLRQALDFPAI